MEKMGITIALALIYGFNAWIAFFASILAAGGDGASAGVVFVGTIFGLVIALCLAGSIAFATRKMFIRSVLSGVAALPFAFGMTFGIWWLVVSIKELAT
jgi:hypothetical protein